MPISLNNKCETCNKKLSLFCNQTLFPYTNCSQAKEDCETKESCENGSVFRVLWL